MAQSVQVAPTSVSGRSPASPTGSRRATVGGVAAVATAVALAMIWFGETTLHASRVRNPDPAATGGPSLGVWGISDKTWLSALMVGTLVVVAGLVVGFVRYTRRVGRLHHGLGIFVGLTVSAWLLDPIFNWSMYGVYNPRLLHFPVTWLYQSVSPTIEPYWPMFCYPFFWLAPAFAVFGLYRLVRRRIRPESLIGRHQTVALLAFGFLLGVVYDIVIELFLMNAGVWFYSQTWGPVLHWDNGYLPLTEAIVVGLEIALMVRILEPFPDGATFASRLGAAVPSLRDKRHGHHAAVAALTFLVIACHIGFYAGLRLGKLDTTVSGRWQYPAAKVYDPDGLFRGHGQTGPFFRGVWAS